MKLIIISIFVLLIISTPFAFGDHNSITVTTDKASYSEGEIIVISGEVVTVEGNTPITLQIFSSSGGLVDISQIAGAQDGTYSHTIIPDKYFVSSGPEYIIRVSYGEESIAETGFNLTYSTVPEPRHEPIPELEPTPEPTPVIEQFSEPDPTQITICHTPSNSQQTITISEDTLDYHLNHGDTVGECQSNNNQDNTILKDKVSSLENTISEIQQDNTLLKVENKKLKNNNNVLQSQIDELNLKITDLQSIIMEQIKVFFEVIQEIRNK